MRLAVVALSFASLLSGAAMAQTQTAPADPTAAAAAQPADDKPVCVEQDSGGNSRLGTRKLCHTQKEWDAMPRARR